MKTKFWTPREANRTLPLVQRIVKDILSCGREWREISKEQEEPRSHERAGALERQLAEHMRELEGIGCYYKDWGFDMGLVDFPARIGGEAAFLCWRSDEREVAWYHPVEGGYASRQPIPPELLG